MDLSFDFLITSSPLLLLSLSILVILFSWRFFFLDVWREALQVHLLILHLDLKVLEVAPFGEDFHRLDVFNGSKLLSVVLVAT